MTRCLLSFTAFCLLALIFTSDAQATGTSVRSDPGTLLIPPPMIDPPRADGMRCFMLVNRASYTVLGAINTNYYTTAAGIQARKNANFRLSPGQRQEVCTRGPYYAGERIELVLRTIVPIFSCYTVAQGEITIFGERKPEGGTRTWANCQ
jgi:hypothetical protein